MTEFLPSNATPIVPTDQRKRTVKLGIDPTGDVATVGLDRRNSSPADRDLEVLIRSVPFIPAMEGGIPIAADLTLELGAFVP